MLSLTFDGEARCNFLFLIVYCLFFIFDFNLQFSQQFLYQADRGATPLTVIAQGVVKRNPVLRDKYLMQALKG